MQVSRFRLKPLVLFLATFWAGSVAATPTVTSASGDLISPYSASLGGWYFHVTPSIAVDGLDQNHDECGSNCGDSSSALDFSEGMDVSANDTLGFSDGMLVSGPASDGSDDSAIEDPGFGPGPGVTQVCDDGLGFSGSDPLCEFPPPTDLPPEEEPPGEEPPGGELPGGELSGEEPPGGEPHGEESPNGVDAPATLALFGLGLLVLGYSRQRRRKR
jgi:hypothetical protein